MKLTRVTYPSFITGTPPTHHKGVIMSYIQDIDFEFEVGDRFDLTPIEGSYLIGKISALGGECYLEGNTVVVTAIPGKTAILPAPELIPAAVEEAPPAPEPVKVEKVAAPVADVKATPEPKVPPIKRTQKVTRSLENAKSEVTPIPAPVEE